MRWGKGSGCVQSTFLESTVGKIYMPIFSFFRKRVVNIMISDLRPVSNESPGNFTFYRGIHEFLNPSIFVKITVFFYFML